MKVLLPEGIELRGFERALQDTLEQANLSGYALMGFTYVEASTPQTHEIDALLILEPGVFVCLEAKGYSGTWTGSASGKWFCNNQEIQAVNGNPYKQVEKYMYVIKNKLTEGIFQDVEQNLVWVNSLVVAPDNSELQINDAVIDEFRPRTILICHLSNIENVVSTIRSNRRVTAKVRELGDLLEIPSELTGMSVEDLRQLIVEPSDRQSQELPDSQSTLPEPITPPIEEPQDLSDPDPTQPDPNPFLKVIIGIVAVVILGTGLTYYIWNNRSCEDPEEIRVEGGCYKDLSKNPLVIGILTAPEEYSLLRDYLRQKLGSEAVDVVIKGGADTTYQDAQNNIAEQNWDVVFAWSPMNGMRAKDNGYQWVARMFPDYPATYQSALFVRQDSPIQSINDITASTKIALGDFSSASSFYIPSYDLYGKSMTVMPGNRSGKIIELVASGEADIGAGVYTRVRDDSRFRVIQVSREIPGTGVYLSPKLPPTVSKKIAQILMDAPPEIQEEANYGPDEELDYEVLRLISLRVDEILSCADFSQNPVQFFCPETSEGIVGTIRGWKREDNEFVRLRFEQDNGGTCDIVTSLQTLSGVPNGTSPGVLNRKRVSLLGVEPEQINEACQIILDNPAQLKVISPE